MALAAMREQLDMLMGPNRNGEEDSNKNPTDFRDENVCKMYICGLCPHLLFSNTKADIGVCQKVHKDELAESYKEALKNGEHFRYEQDLESYCRNLIADVDRRIQKALKRLQVQYGLEDTEGLLVSDPELYTRKLPTHRVGDKNPGLIEDEPEEEKEESETGAVEKDGQEKTDGKEEAGDDDDGASDTGAIDISMIKVINVAKDGDIPTPAEDETKGREHLASDAEARKPATKAEDEGKLDSKPEPPAEDKPIDSALKETKEAAENGSAKPETSEKEKTEDAGDRENKQDLLAGDKPTEESVGKATFKWAARTAPDGKPFWRNLESGESTWEQPPEEEIEPEGKDVVLKDTAEKKAGSDDGKEKDEEEAGTTLDKRQKLRVCEQCGAFLSIFDSEKRLQDHFGGKMHLGYLGLRRKLDELRESTAEDLTTEGEGGRDPVTGEAEGGRSPMGAEAGGMMTGVMIGGMTRGIGDGGQDPVRMKAERQVKGPQRSWSRSRSRPRPSLRSRPQKKKVSFG
eukprot:CAMPEP_0113958442 /NCGR_PEP_ID=MMETSP0011_2-20120614/3426_1 /TAXON_ID=101924 /ORGANISM="Rhodosorus marinus" /LENGTH=515 /DNA_ID=CAMNT_0000969313 /DNA_START=121 /DNA_END=1670 /DNA_ORIENTATION=+ /assembly_acc=CAM_ASM_000156